jgi:hypothetical protein
VNATSVLLDAIAKATGPSLRDVLIDALDDAYWFQRGEVEDCPRCRRSPAGVCPDPDHQNANARALEYEEARKQMQRTPGDPEVLAVLGSEGRE